MNHHLNPSKVGLAVGTFAGILHLIWALCVGLGWAQTLANFSMWAHMVKAPYAVQPFSFGTAVVLVITATAVGYVVGVLFVRVWNRVYRA